MLREEDNKFTKGFIKSKEERRLKVYDDATGRPIVPGTLVQGHPTIGWGRCLDTKGINAAEADELFENDFMDAEAAVVSIFGIGIFEAGRKKVTALISMAYNLGEKGLRGFVEMVKAVKAGDWKRAAAESRDSLRYKQIGKRAEEEAQMLEGGEEG